MFRTTAVPRPIRTGVALLGVAGIAVLSGCAGTADAAAESEETQAVAQTPAATPTDEATPAEEAAAANDSIYADGTYTASGAYQTPESVEQVAVTVTLEGDVITAVEVTGDPQARESQNYQGQFIGGIADVVVGQSIDEISVSRVAGSSLTSGGFNEAIEEIKSEAKA